MKAEWLLTKGIIRLVDLYLDAKLADAPLPPEDDPTVPPHAGDFWDRATVISDKVILSYVEGYNNVNKPIMLPVPQEFRVHNPEPLENGDSLGTKFLKDQRFVIYPLGQTYETRVRADGGFDYRLVPAGVHGLTVDKFWKFADKIWILETAVEITPD